MAGKPKPRPIHDMKADVEARMNVYVEFNREYMQSRIELEKKRREVLDALNSEIMVLEEIVFKQKDIIRRQEEELEKYERK